MVRLSFADVLDLVPIKPGQRRLTRKKPSAKAFLDQSLSKSSSTADLDKVAADLLEVKVARLDWRDIEAIEHLEPLTNLEDLYLQHNKISAIENLEFHMHLSFLALGHNQITEVVNLRHLRQLVFLDLSHNQICEFDVAELPTSLISLDLRHNPIQQHEYQERALEALSKLCTLDGEKVRSGEDDEDDDDDDDESCINDGSEDEVDVHTDDANDSVLSDQEGLDKQAIEEESTIRPSSEVESGRSGNAVAAGRSIQRVGVLPTTTVSQNQRDELHNEGGDKKLDATTKPAVKPRRRQPDYYKQRLMELSADRAEVIRASVSSRMQAIIERSKERAKNDAEVFGKRTPTLR
jgi:hypothetical protein